MAKPIKNRIVTGSACLDYADKDIGFVSCAPGSTDSIFNFRIGGGDRLDSFFPVGEMAVQFVSPTTYQSHLEYQRNINFDKFSHTNRVCGLILDDNDDGSYKIAVLGTDILDRNASLAHTGVSCNIITDTINVGENDTYDFPGLPIYNGTASDPCYAYVVVVDGSTNTGERVAVSDLFDVALNFGLSNRNITSATFTTTGKYNNTEIAGRESRYQLTTDKTTTLQLGIPINEMTVVTYNSHCFMYDTYNTIFDAWEGNYYDLIDTIYQSIRLQSVKKPAAVVAEGGLTNMFTRADLTGKPKLAGYEGKTHAFNFTPFNLILTRNESQALAYLENGTLPSDAFLYPLDWQNLPRTDGTPSSDEEDPDYKPPSGEDGDSGIDGTPTRDADPQITSNMLTNNNLYWLQAGQLESFITWFWQNAGEIIELDDLWDRIKGLYNDLASAIINIRYFPVDPYYIGGVSDTTNIVLSSIEMPITGIKKLNKTKLRKRTLGEISIPNKYNAFTDYSPYTSLMLYLPFHGWIDLDIDIFTGNKLQVRCIYDHISGTIQYGVYVISKGKEFLLNTVIAKMAVDIPITLQSKNDRDSAIFNNVTNAFGNLLGAGASAVSGNPIGLVMSTAGVASSGTQSAPLKVNGTVGETGAFFMPNKCAVYIKRPSYNRPKNYGSRVGFPSNKGGKLSEFSGFTTVYNPQITFSGNTNADNVTMKPMQSEIEEIYSALEKGVIL